MNTEQLLLRLPEELAQRFRRSVPKRERNAFVQRLLEQALPPPESDEDPLYRAALAVEQDSDLNAEMAGWEVATLKDDLCQTDRSAKRRRSDQGDAPAEPSPSCRPSGQARWQAPADIHDFAARNKKRRGCRPSSA